MPAKRDLPPELERLKEQIARDEEHVRVCKGAARTVGDLIRLSADGDRLVVFFVFALAFQLVAELESIVEARPKLGRWLARYTFIWPAFISRKRSFKQENEKLLNTLQLGEGVIFSGGKWHPDALSTRAAWAVLYLGNLRARAGQSPQLSGKNKKQWFDDNWDSLLDNGFKPEKTLGKLGASKARKKPKYCKKLHPATQLANLRSEIKSRVWQAFDKIFLFRELISLAGGN